MLQAFVELQSKYNETYRQLQTVNAQLGIVDREKKKLVITCGELAQTPAGTPSYKAIGASAP